MMLAGSPFLNGLLALLITLALMLGLALIVRRFNLTNLSNSLASNRRLRKVESLTLTPHHSLHVIEVNGKERVLMTSPQKLIELFPSDNDKL
ncbi:MAG: hypothetical protein WAZ18_02865 [Alphaproteobacteria bacterium]